MNAAADAGSSLLLLGLTLTGLVGFRVRSGSDQTLEHTEKS
jgi:hypothetical protein